MSPLVDMLRGLLWESRKRKEDRGILWEPPPTKLESVREGVGEMETGDYGRGKLKKFKTVLPGEDDGAFTGGEDFVGEGSNFKGRGFFCCNS